MSSEKGQTLIELIVVIVVAILVVTSLTFATISSIRNSQAAKNASQGTKLAQEGMEKVRSGRDNNNTINMGVNGVYNWNSGANIFWNFTISSSCGNPPATYCYFYINSTNSLTIIGPDVDSKVLSLAESLNNGQFRREIIISDDVANVSKKITVLVIWNDFSGQHESRLTTILSKLP